MPLVMVQTRDYHLPRFPHLYAVVCECDSMGNSETSWSTGRHGCRASLYSHGGLETLPQRKQKTCATPVRDMRVTLYAPGW